MLLQWVNSGMVTSGCKKYTSECVSVDGSRGKLHLECVAQSDMNYAWKRYMSTIHCNVNKLCWITGNALLAKGATAFLSKHPFVINKTSDSCIHWCIVPVSNEYRPIVCSVFTAIKLWRINWNIPQNGSDGQRGLLRRTVSVMSARDV